MAWVFLLEDARGWDRARLSGILAAAPHIEKNALKDILSGTREDELRELMDPPTPDEVKAYERLEDFLKG